MSLIWGVAAALVILAIWAFIELFVLSGTQERNRYGPPINSDTKIS